LSKDDSKELLDELRAECGDSKFGYRLQAVFAHVLLRLGAEILEINARGHPDVRARLGDRELLVQVKTAAHRWAESMFEMLSDDFRGISERGRREGFLALLDCAEPVQWLLVSANRASQLIGQPVHISALKADCDAGLSEDCTLEFRTLLSVSAGRILKMTYPTLCRRALKGDSL
jgi:hypothetical protein